MKEIYPLTPEQKEKALSQAHDFFENEKQYQMGFIDAEQSHPVTKELGRTFRTDTNAGVRLLWEVDRLVAAAAEKVLTGEGYALFADTVYTTLKNGGRITFSGCGSTGRLSMQLERSWKVAVRNLAKANPEKAEKILPMADLVDCIMTGGDFAVIRAVEMFEDFTVLGARQTQQYGLKEGDLLVGITATGETTSILGTAQQALENGANVYMLICSDPAVVTNRMERTRIVYHHKNTKTLFLPCGPMALTGSTRMQSSTFEQFISAVALETALCRIVQDMGIEIACPTPQWYGQQFVASTESVGNEVCLNKLAALVEQERDLYQSGHLVTYFATDYILDVLTDTTERSPTFVTPPFRARDDFKGQPSWAFVKDPTRSTPEAWKNCFGRPMRCIDWPMDEYLAMGFDGDVANRIPDISNQALGKFAIGCEPDTVREGENSLAIWVGTDAPDPAFFDHARRYGKQDSLTLADCGIAAPSTPMEIFAHLALKQMLNIFSTGTMACMGRVDGNFMTFLAMSNKKLVDRSARIVAMHCEIPYPVALEEIYCAKLWADSQTDGVPRSPAQLVIQKYGKR